MSLKDFKNCDVQYAYDKDVRIYSIRINFKEKPAILTIRVGKDLMDMTLTDNQGNKIEYIGQDKGNVTFNQNLKLAQQFLNKKS